MVRSDGGETDAARLGARAGRCAAPHAPAAREVSSDLCVSPGYDTAARYEREDYREHILVDVPASCLGAIAAQGYEVAS